MDKDVLMTKIESLMRCLGRIQEKTPSSVEELESSLDAQDIISVNLERAIQMSVDISSHIAADFSNDTPQTMSQSFLILAKHGIIPDELAASMVKAVGFRNIAVHQYQSVDLGIVYSIVTKNLDDFKKFLACVKNYMDR